MPPYTTGKDRRTSRTDKRKEKALEAIVFERDFRQLLAAGIWKLT
jgi:hypothetical protein